jgi:hypothetical protein
MIGESGLILASASPQRRAILEQLGVPFEVRPAGVEELAAGEPREVALVPIGGARVVRGHGELVGGPLDAPGAKEAALAAARATRRAVLIDIWKDP